METRGIKPKLICMRLLLAEDLAILDSLLSPDKCLTVT